MMGWRAGASSPWSRYCPRRRTRRLTPPARQFRFALGEPAMPVLLLTEDNVRQLLTMNIALEAVEEGLRRLALDEAVNVPRARAQTDHTMLHILSAAAKGLGYMGYKAYSTGRKGAEFHLGLYDGKT